MLAIVAMALLAGRREIAEIARFATTLSQKQRHLLGLPRKKMTKAFYQVPTYSVFYALLTRLDPEAFAAHVHGWLQAHADALPQALAMDGKLIRDQIGLLTLAQHEDGAPQAVAICDQKEATPRCEQLVATAVLESLPALDNKTITADALHCLRPNARAIGEKGGEYLLQIKANQLKLLDQAQAFDALPNTPFFSSKAAGTDESKIEACTPSQSTPSKPTSPSPAA